MKNLTLDDLLARARQSDDNKLKITTYESTVLGGVIKIHRPPLNKIANLLEVAVDEDNLYKASLLNAEIVYEAVPLLHDKALLESYGEKDPVEMVMKLFDENVAELNAIASKVVAFYGIDKLVEQTKN